MTVEFANSRNISQIKQKLAKRRTDKKVKAAAPLKQKETHPGGDGSKPTEWPCTNCGRLCKSQIGLRSHLRKCCRDYPNGAAGV